MTATADVTLPTGVRVRALAREPVAMERYVQGMWTSGVNVEAIARSLNTHHAGVAELLLLLDDETLVAGLRMHLGSLVDARAEKKPATRKVKPGSWPG